MYTEWCVKRILDTLPAEVAILRTDEEILKEHLLECISDFEDEIHDQYREW